MVINVMKTMHQMSKAEFTTRLKALKTEHQNQNKVEFRKRLDALLGQIGDALQFRALWQLCLNLGVSSRLRRKVIVAWDQAMAVKLMMQVELRKPVFAGLAWFKQHLHEYIAIFQQCAPGAGVALRIRRLLAAVGCQMPA